MCVYTEKRVLIVDLAPKTLVAIILVQRFSMRGDFVLQRTFDNVESYF